MAFFWGHPVHSKGIQFFVQQPEYLKKKDFSSIKYVGDIQKSIHIAVDAVATVSDVLMDLLFVLFLPSSVQKVCR